MSQYNSTITKIVMNSDFNCEFYNQYDLLVVELDHTIKVSILGTYLICSDDNNSVKFFVNTVTLISGPTFSQAYTPLSVGFYQQDSAYFNRLNEIKTYIETNVVKVLYRGINALFFGDGTVQKTAGGSVSSVGFVEGTGIDITGTNPITTSGTITITNTAPDQVVTLTDGTGIDVTGTYPSFTITNTAPDQTVSLTDGTAIDVTGTYPSFTINNTAPDQTVVLSNGTGISTSGTYPNFTITNTAPDQTVVLTEGSGIDITGTYPNFTIASTITGGIPKGTAAGTDTYTTTITGVTAYNDGDAYLIRFTNGNTTGATLNINSLGAIDLYRNNDGALIGGDIVDGAEMLCVYNSSTNRFQVIGTAPNSLLGYVTNADSVAITKGMPVYAFGGQGDRLTVKRANNSSDATSAQTIGLVLSTSIGVNQKGLIMMQGLLDGLSIVPTSTWADGDPVYLGSTAGTITKTKPYAPNHLVYLGFVTSASPGSAGRIYVKVQNGYELDELHNVQAQSPSLKDTLYYDNTVSPAQWKTASIATILGYTPQEQLTLTTTGSSGAATLVGSTLNIPQYSGSGSSTSIQTITGSTTALAAGTTRYGTVAGTTSEAQVSIPLASACTMNNLYVRTTATMPVNSSLQVTLVKNGTTATSVTVTIAAGSAAGIYSDTTNNATYSAGDRYQIEFKNTGSATAAPTSGQSFKITI